MDIRLIQNYTCKAGQAGGISDRDDDSNLYQTDDMTCENMRHVLEVDRQTTPCLSRSPLKRHPVVSISFTFVTFMSRWSLAVATRSRQPLHYRCFIEQGLERLKVL